MREHPEFLIPGETVVKKAIENNINIVPIPGACAAVTAIIASGISTQGFVFIGFLPVNTSEKTKRLEEVKDETKTLIFYEAPHKLIKTLDAMKRTFGDRKITLCKELTKIHEEFIRGTISKIVENIKEPKGEYVIIVEGATKSKKELETEERNKLSLKEHYEYYERNGFEKKEIIKQIAKDRGVSKNEIYKYFV